MDGNGMMNMAPVMAEPVQVMAPQEVLEENQELQQMQQMQQQIEDEEQLRQEREAQIRREVQAVRASVHVLQPKESIEKKTFSKKSRNYMSAKKRQYRSGVRGSALRRKKLNAESLGAAEQQYQQRVAEQEVFYVVDLVGEFQGLNLQVDLRNDDTIVAESQRLEEISAKTKALKTHLDRNPQVLENMLEIERAKIKTKLEIATHISDYYQIQKKVITNPYYRTHYNSEISYVYRDTDTLEQRNLALLIWQAEVCRKKAGITGNTRQNQWLSEYTDSNKKEIAQENHDRNRFQNNLSQAEYGKNDGRIEDSPHAEYFRKHNNAGDPVFDQLKGKAYQVSGVPIKMSESFARNLSNIPRMKAVQHMAPEALQQMIGDLIKKPQNAADAEEVTQCKEANIRGLRQYKEVIRKQLDYLKRKYGNGFLLLTPEEIIKHQNEFDNDFTNMQGMTELISYMKDLRAQGVDLWNNDNAADAEMQQIADYYQSCALMEGIMRNMYLQNQMDVNTYSDYKRKSATLLVENGNYVSGNIATLDTMHLDVKWDTAFDEGNLQFDDVLVSLNAQKFNEYKKQFQNPMTQEQLKRFRWNMLFDQFKNDEDAAVSFLLEKEMGSTVDAMRQTWRAGGLTFGSIKVPGIGTDDFTILNDTYKKILTDETVRDAYGITTPELLEEFKGYVDKTADMAEVIKTNDAYADRALAMLDKVRAAAQNADQVSAALLRQLAGKLDNIADVYIEKNRAYRSGEGTENFNKFSEFRERVGMWTFPQHREVMENTVEPEIQRQIPEETLNLGDLQIPVMKELAEQLQGPIALKDDVTLEQFQEAVREYNKEEARYRVLCRIYSHGETEEEMEKEPLWQAVTSKKGFFQFDISNRFSSCGDRKREITQKIKDMLK